tara:strand:- start:207 stop:434 length:228 start_codon:yes stop_codon:yes gene_type:complete
MTYSSHLLLSLELSAMFFTGGVCAIIHGVVPDVFTKSSTIINQKITNKIQSSGCRNGEKTNDNNNNNSSTDDKIK